MVRILILLLVSVLLFFVGNNLLPFTDPVEGNYTQTAKEMLFSGDYFSPRIYGGYWYDKPVFFYWELIAAYKMFGINEFAARFFPALMATFGVFATYFFGRKLFDKSVGFIAAVILMTSLEYWYIAHAVITDMTLFLTVSLALMFFYVGYTENRSRYFYAAYFMAAIAVLTKGPIGLCLPGLIILLFLLSEKNLGHLKKLCIPTGMILFFAVVSTWYYPMYKIHGSDFIMTFLGVHNVLRASVSEHPEVNVWYYSTLVFIAGFFPWSFYVIPKVIKKYYAKLREKLAFPKFDKSQKFLLIWAVAVFVVFQSFATKYVTYTLPYMMPIAILFALVLKENIKIFKITAVAITVLLPILLFTVAIPMCEKNSEKDAAAVMKTYANNGAYLISVGGRYPTTLVFYSDCEIVRVDNRKRVMSLRPNGLTWKATNVMPILPFDALPENRDIVAFVRKKQKDDFLRHVKGKWNLVDETRTAYIYERKRLTIPNYFYEEQR